MKKVFALLWLFASELVLTLCCFSVSATEKPNHDLVSFETGVVISNVSRGALFIVLDLEVPNPGDNENVLKLENNNLAIMPYVTRLILPEPVNDPYLQRSQSWIKWNNINALGKSSEVKNVTLPESNSLEMLC